MVPLIWKSWYLPKAALSPSVEMFIPFFPFLDSQLNYTTLLLAAVAPWGGGFPGLLLPASGEDGWWPRGARVAQVPKVGVPCPGELLFSPARPLRPLPQRICGAARGTLRTI